MTDGRFTAAMAADGDMSETSRWSGAKTDEQWLQVDMGSVKTVSEIVIRFHAEPTDWELLVSADGKDWEQVHEVVGGKDGGVKAKGAGPRVGLLFHSARSSERGQALN